MDTQDLSIAEMGRMLRAGSRHRRRHWRATRWLASPHGTARCMRSCW